MAAAYEPSILDYLLIMRRRASYLIGIFVSVLLVSIIYAIVAPPTYRATGTIAVESQQLTDTLEASARRNQIDDQINVIFDRMMTRSNLMGIVKKYDLFKGSISSQSPSEIIDKMRDRITIEKGGDDFSTSSSQRPVSFTLSFDDRNPEVAFNVTNDLISLFLDLSVKLQIMGATESADFLSQESQKLKATVDELDQKIAKYKHEHSNALPEQLTMRMAMMDRSQNDLLEVERDYRSTQDDLRALGVELNAANNGIGDGTSQLETLPALKAEYARLTAIYSDSYPDVKAIKRKIDALEKSGKTSSGMGSNAPTSIAAYKIQAKIASDNARLQSLAQQKEILQRKIAANENAMIQTPGVEEGLAGLIRDRDTAEKKYAEIRNNQMNAQIAQNLVTDDKAARFSVLEPPLLPEKPYKPKRLKIAVLGFFLAMVSSVGSVLVLESVNKRVRGSEELTSVLGHRPMVVIPYFPSKEDEERRNHMIRTAVNLAFAAVKEKVGWVGTLEQKLLWVAPMKRKLSWVADLKRKFWG
jgi:protein tyrosine kinase modulator